jgi:hypothetical protein
LLAARNGRDNDGRSGLLDARLAWINEMSWCAIGTKPSVP